MARDERVVRRGREVADRPLPGAGDRGGDVAVVEQGGVRGEALLAHELLVVEAPPPACPAPGDGAGCAAWAGCCPAAGSAPQVHLFVVSGLRRALPIVVSRVGGSAHRHPSSLPGMTPLSESAADCQPSPRCSACSSTTRRCFLPASRRSPPPARAPWPPRQLVCRTDRPAARARLGGRRSSRAWWTRPTRPCGSRSSHDRGRVCGPSPKASTCFATTARSSWPVSRWAGLPSGGTSTSRAPSPWRSPAVRTGPPRSPTSHATPTTPGEPG